MSVIRAKLLTLLAPTLSFGLLAAGVWVQRDWPQPVDAAPYHARCKTAIDAIPDHMGDFIGTDLQPQLAAIEILKPNAIRNIELVDPRPRRVGKPPQRISMSVVQCRSSDDMLGHSPPKCYPAFGDRQLSAQHREWVIGPDAPVLTGDKSVPSMTPASDLRIDGVEYHFERVIDGQMRRRIVYNFMIAPRRGILPDMESLRRAAEDYRQRYFGAAQFQVVFDTLAGQESSQPERDEVFTTLMRSAEPAIRVMLDDSSQVPVILGPTMSPTIPGPAATQPSASVVERNVVSASS